MLLVVCSLLLVLAAGFSFPTSAHSSGSAQLVDEDHEENYKIKVLGLLPTNASDAAINASNPSYFTHGSVIQKAVEMALEDIENMEELLPGYDLELQVADSGCDVGKSSFHLAKEALKSDNAVVVLGPQCNAPVRLIGQIIDRKTNLITVNYGARASDLSDTSKYKSLFHTVSPTSELNKGIFDLLKKFKWERICVGVQEVNDYIELAVNFLTYVETQSSNFTVDVIHFVTERSIEFLATKVCRVFVIFAEPWGFPYTACEFHKYNLTGENFQTIFVGKLDRNYLFVAECPYTTAFEAVQSSLSVHFRDTDQENDQLNDYEDIQRGAVFKDNLNAELNRTFGEIPYLSQGNYDIAAAAYDAMWSIALALNASIEPLAQHNLTLEDYLPFSNSSIREIIIEEFEKLSFQGIYKHVEFTENRHFPIETVIVSQLQGYELVPVAQYDSITKVLTAYRNASFKWIGSGPPPDRPSVIQLKLPDSVHIVMIAITLLGLLLCFAFFIFNCYFRNNRIIKASSPNINNVIIFGCLLIFLSVTSLSFETYDLIPDRVKSFFCNVTLWTSICGFTLSFGALTVKTWRVYRVFKNPWSRNRIYKDSSLHCIITGLLGIDVFLLALLTVISPLRSLEIKIYTVEYTYSYQQCEDRRGYAVIFIAIIIIYQTLVLASAAFLAFQTRGIKSKAFNDSKFITWAIYMVVFTSLIGVPMAIFTGLGDHPVLAIYTISVTISLYGFIMLLTVFIPKIIVLFKKRKEKITSVVASTANTITYERRSSAYYLKNPGKEKMRKNESTLSFIKE